MIEINSYTTVKRRERVPHDIFATYWRDVHGPLCSRLPGLGLYIQHHFRETRMRTFGHSLRVSRRSKTTNWMVAWKSAS